MSDSSNSAKEANETPAETPKHIGGVFITEGMKITIPEGGFSFSISPEGEFEASPIELHVGIDLCPYWLKIACSHYREAEKASTEVKKLAPSTDGKMLGIALEKEFQSSMQTITSIAFAIDALYAGVKDNITIPANLTDAWKKNGTARHKQISEVFSLAFKLGPESKKKVRQVVEEIMRFRGWAVHPPSGVNKPILHPQLLRSTEWRFVAFRHENALAAIRFPLSFIPQLSSVAKKRFKQLKEYCDRLGARVEPMVNEWEKDYGSLNPEASDENQ